MTLKDIVLQMKANTVGYDFDAGVTSDFCRGYRRATDDLIELAKRAEEELEAWGAECVRQEREEEYLG